MEAVEKRPKATVKKEVSSKDVEEPQEPQEPQEHSVVLHEEKVEDTREASIIESIGDVIQALPSVPLQEPRVRAEILEGEDGIHHASSILYPVEHQEEKEDIEDEEEEEEEEAEGTSDEEESPRPALQDQEHEMGKSYATRLMAQAFARTLPSLEQEATAQVTCGICLEEKPTYYSHSKGAGGRGSFDEDFYHRTDGRASGYVGTGPHSDNMEDGLYSDDESSSTASGITFSDDDDEQVVGGLEPTEAVCVNSKKIMTLADRIKYNEGRVSAEKVARRNNRAERRRQKEERDFARTFSIVANPWVSLPECCGSEYHRDCLDTPLWIKYKSSGYRAHLTEEEDQDKHNKRQRKGQPLMICPLCSEPGEDEGCPSRRNILKAVARKVEKEQEEEEMNKTAKPTLMKAAAEFITLKSRGDGSVKVGELTAEQERLAHAISRLIKASKKQSLAGKSWDKAQWDLMYPRSMSGDRDEEWENARADTSISYETLRKCGFTINDIHSHITDDFAELVQQRALTMKQLKEGCKYFVHHYQLSPQAVRKAFGDQLTIEVLARGKFTPNEMLALGFTAHQLCLMGMEKRELRLFSDFNMRDWVEKLFFSKTHALILGITAKDFTSNNMFRNTPWKKEGFVELLDLTTEEQLHLGLASTDRYFDSNRGRSRGQGHRHHRREKHTSRKDAPHQRPPPHAITRPKRVHKQSASRGRGGASPRGRPLPSLRDSDRNRAKPQKRS